MCRNCFICSKGEEMVRKGKVNQTYDENGNARLVCFSCSNKLKMIKNKKNKSWKEIKKEINVEQSSPSPRLTLSDKEEKA